MIICVAAQKGGVAKSSTCHALGSFIRGAILIDADAQMTLTSAVAGAHTHTLHEVLTSKCKLVEAVVPSLPAYSNLKIVPASQQLAGLDAATAGDLNRNYLLADALHGINETVIIDCPAGVTVATITALTAAHVVVVPTATSPAAFETVEGFERTIDLVKKRLNPRLEWILLPTLFSQRQVLDREVLAALRDRYGERVLTPIPRRISISERMAAQLPCNDPSYQHFANTLLERISP